MARGEQEQALAGVQVARRERPSAPAAGPEEAHGPERAAPAWTEKRIEQELRGLIRRKGLDRFPKHAELDEVRGLHDAVRRSGGSVLWAERLGLALAEQGDRRFPGEAGIEAELRRVVENLGLERFPSVVELEQAVGPSLVAAVRRHGGARSWAQRLGVEVSSSHWPEEWGQEWIERELRAFVQAHGLKRFPTYRELSEAGHRELAKRIEGRGGVRYWAERLGLQPSERSIQQRWSEERIESELRAFIKRRGLGRMPTGEELGAAGLSGLAGAIERFGGFTEWAERLGYASNRGAPKVWNASKVEAELRSFLAEHGYEGDRLPPRSYFVERGRGDLHRAIHRHGGVRRFAPALGYEWTEASTPEEQERKLREAVSGREEMPSAQELRELGVYGFIQRHGGIERWAKELGVKAPRRARRTPESLESELREFIGDRDYFPSQREFREAGMLGLHTSLRRSGGIAHWRKKLGLPQAAPGPRRRPKPGRTWTREALLAELGPYVERLGHFPSRSELRSADRGDLLTAVRKFGGARRLARELGAEMAPTGKRQA